MFLCICCRYTFSQCHPHHNIGSHDHNGCPYQHYSRYPCMQSLTCEQHA